MSTEKKFNPAIPRLMFWSRDCGGTGQCPRCQTRLENESQTYLMVVRDDDDYYPSLTGNDAGYFCPKCLTVVLDFETFAEFAQISMDPGKKAQYFTVAGLVDVDAVPPEKRNIPLGADNNPIPLVKFIDRGSTGVKRTPAPTRKRKRIKRKQKR